jgi:hypothetical protein
MGRYPSIAPRNFCGSAVPIKKFARRSRSARGTSGGPAASPGGRRESAERVRAASSDRGAYGGSGCLPERASGEESLPPSAPAGQGPAADPDQLPELSSPSLSTKAPCRITPISTNTLRRHSRSSGERRVPPLVYPGAFEGSSLREACCRTVHTSRPELLPPGPDHIEGENRKSARPGVTRCTLGSSFLDNWRKPFRTL